MSTKTEDKEKIASLEARIDALSERLELLATATLPASSGAYHDATRAEDGRATSCGQARDRVVARKAALKSLRGAAIAEEDAAENRADREREERNKVARERREREEIEREKRERARIMIHPLGLDPHTARAIEGVLVEIAPTVDGLLSRAGRSRRRDGSAVQLEEAILMVTLARSRGHATSRDFIGERLQKLANRPSEDTKNDPAVLLLAEHGWSQGDRAGCRATIALLPSNADAVKAVKYEKPHLVQPIEAHRGAGLLFVYVSGAGDPLVFEAYRGPNAPEPKARAEAFERRLAELERLDAGLDAGNVPGAA